MSRGNDDLERDLRRFGPAGPPESLRRRLLARAAEEAALTPFEREFERKFEGELRRFSPGAPAADLRGRILEAALRAGRRRTLRGRSLSAAAALLVAVSIPVNAWIEGGRTGREVPPFSPPPPPAREAAAEPWDGGPRFTPPSLPGPVRLLFGAARGVDRAAAAWRDLREGFRILRGSGEWDPRFGPEGPEGPGGPAEGEGGVHGG